MRKLISILSVLVLCGFMANAQVNLQSGLLGYYPFSGNANDLSGNSNHGTVTGASLTTDRFGNSNGAYQFNGTSNYILLPNNLDLSTRSVVMWFNAEDADYTSDVRNIFDYNFPNQVNGSLIAYIKDIEGIKKLLLIGCSIIDTVDISLNTWHNIALVFNTDKSIKYYFDGNLIGSKSYETPLTSVNGLPNLVIGSSRTAANRFFNGKIDDIRSYNRALNDQEIQVLYQEGQAVNLQNGLIAKYSFTGNANDESGNSNNGTVTGASLTGDRFGNSNSAYQFNGTSNYILLPNIMDLLTRSVVMWFNAEDADYSTDIRSILDYDFPTMINASLGANIKNIGGVKKLILTGNGINDTADILLNSWHNIALVFNSDKTIKYYFDGNLIGSKSYITDLHSINGLNNLIVGASRTTANRYFKGKIDDIRLYNRALNIQEVQALYAEGTAITTTNQTTNLGNQVEIPIATTIINASENVISYQFNFDYDQTKLQYVDKSLVGTIAANGNIVVNSSTPGHLQISYMTSTPLSGVGNILKLKFNTLAVGNSPITISNFLYNTKPVINIMSSIVSIIENVPPTAAITYSDADAKVKPGDILVK